MRTDRINFFVTGLNVKVKLGGPSFLMRVRLFKNLHFHYGLVYTLGAERPAISGACNVNGAGSDTVLGDFG